MLQPRPHQVPPPAPACPAPDLPALLYKLLLPIRMENVVKDAMLDIARTVPSPERRLAAWMRFDLPAGLPEALAEIESLR